jgi:hypothetical protein
VPDSISQTVSTTTQSCVVRAALQIPRLGAHVFSHTLYSKTFTQKDWHKFVLLVDIKGNFPRYAVHIKNCGNFMGLDNLIISFFKKIRYAILFIFDENHRKTSIRFK